MERLLNMLWIIQRYTFYYQEYIGKVEMSFLKKIKIQAFIILCVGVLASSASLANGKAIDISAYKGKVVMVDFWASWCTPCRKSFPWLNQMHASKSSQGLVILGVNVDEDSADAQRFLKKYQADFKLLYDPKGEYASFYNIPGMPTSLIFDRNGKLVHQHSGFKLKNVTEYETQIDKALAL